MSLLPYALCPPFLFGLDAETAHELTMASLARTQGTPLECAYGFGPGRGPDRTGGPGISQSGGWPPGWTRNARCIDGLGAMGFGFIEVGTVTPKAQPATPGRACFGCRSTGLINRLGFNNEGLDAFIANVGRGLVSPQGTHPRAQHRKNAATPMERAADDYWPAWPASTRTPIT